MTGMNVTEFVRDDEVARIRVVSAFVQEIGEKHDEIPRKNLVASALSLPPACMM